MFRVHTVFAACVLGASASASAATVTVTSLADTAGSCPGTSCTLRAALAAASAGDQIVFGAALALPATITLSGGALALDRNLSIVGPGAARLTLAAGNVARVLNHTAGVVTISGIRMQGGRQVGMNGTSATFGSGGSGQTGSPAMGGCVRVAAGAQMTLLALAMDDCRAQGGNGGNGGSGTTGATIGSTGGRGGQGGSGGSAEGGAVWIAGSLAIQSSSITAGETVGGNGGSGGQGGDGGQGGARGSGGNGGGGGTARGAGIHVANGGALIVRNSTLATGSVSGGVAGSGGNAGPSTTGGDGGVGGSAEGGAISVANSATALVDVEFSSVGLHTLSAGNGGIRGTGGIDGSFGVAGSVRGALVANLGSAGVRFRSAAGFGSCFGTITALAANLGSDASCAGFTVSGSSADFTALGNTSGLAYMRPTRPSLAIDAATNCRDLAGINVTDDQLGGARPQDGDNNGSAACDLGAIEYSLSVFGNGFE